MTEGVAPDFMTTRQHGFDIMPGHLIAQFIFGIRESRRRVKGSPHPEGIQNTAPASPRSARKVIEAERDNWNLVSQRYASNLDRAENLSPQVAET
jgi:hypothetical protein